MKRLSLLTAVLVAAAGFAAPASAAGIDLSGPHYNLNIIGVENPKTTTMTGSDRHTIFVALGKQGDVPSTSRIYLTEGPFQVCDGNAFDAAHSCTGAVVGNQAGAVFQLPCNTANADATACVNGGVDYAIWGRALGKPGGSVTMTTCATDPLTGGLVCDTENAFTFSRGKGKPTFYNVTKQLTTLYACFTVGTVVTCETLSLFDPMLQDYFWQYANKGLRLLQLRFYPI